MPSCALLYTHHTFSVGGAIDITVFSIGDKAGEISGTEVTVDLPPENAATSYVIVFNQKEAGDEEKKVRH